MKILVISLAGIGDSILATPLLRELRLNYPEARIDSLVLWPGAKDLLERSPCLTRLYHKNLLKDPWFGSLRFLWRLRRECYDISINTHPQSRIHYRLVAWLAGARERISHEYECFTTLDRLLITRTLPQDYSRNTVDQNLDVLALLGRKPILPRHQLEVFLAPEDHQWADQLIERSNLQGRILVGVHIGSGGTKNLKLKRWPLASYIELLKRATVSWPQATFLLFGGPEEDPDIDQLMKSVGSPAILRVKGNLRYAAALMKRCLVFLSVDTALMHVAAAVQVPKQIVIEAPTLNKTNEPYEQPYELVRNPVINGRNLEYYRYDGKAIKGSTEELLRCMASVSVDSVFQVLGRHLN